MPRTIPTSEIPAGECRSYAIDNSMVAVFNVDGKFYAMEGTCPHAGGPLGDGFLDGTTVTCPWHGWQFDVTNGVCTFSPEIVQPLCDVRVEGEQIVVEAPPE